jgi:hypothetical protein
MIDYPIDTKNLNDGYVLTFNASTLRYEFVNPDEILSNAATEPDQSGLPSDFLDLLEVDLDNRVNLDGGTW